MVGLGIFAVFYLMRSDLIFSRRTPPDLSYKTSNNKTYVYNHKNLLAVYNNQGNTFIEFWHEGVNLIGGFSSGAPNSNSGGAKKGHSPDYPFGWISKGKKPKWEGFWAGFSYVDKRSNKWAGINGNPAARKSFKIDQPDKTKLLFKVNTQINWLFVFPVFKCEVTYYISPDGIGVKNVVTIMRDIIPKGAFDQAGQFIMTQVECDLDPSQPNVPAKQKDLYFKLATNNDVIAINPFPPYKVPATPSNMYSENNIPNQALVPKNATMAILSPFGRASRNINLALRVDLARSKLPPLEYYCEYNGERDYLNFLFSPAIDTNSKIKVVPKGTQWILYGDLIPWKGSDPKTLFKKPMVSDSIS